MKYTLGFLSFILVLSPAIWAADDLMSRQMVDQAREWSQKGRDDLAAPVWRRLLNVEPNHPEALVKLGLIEARAGNLKEAQLLYQRANRLVPAPKGLKALSSALGATGEAAAVSSELKAAPKSSSATSSAPVEPPKPAVALKESAPIQKPAPSPSAVEVKGEPDEREKRWQERRRKLEKATQDQPGNARHLLALASHLAKREPTRREAIRQLEALSVGSLPPAEVKKPWKEALLALTPEQGDQPLFKRYLERHPASTSVARRLNALEGKTPLKETGQKAQKKSDSSAKTLVKDGKDANVSEKPACSNTPCK